MQASELLFTKDTTVAREELRSRITVQKRTLAAPQVIKDAAVYILRLPSTSVGSQYHSLRTRIVAELRAHLDVLRANPSATLVFLPRLLPEPGTVDPGVEAIARVRDLSRMQFAKECELESKDMTDIVNGVCDSVGHLVIVNRLCSRNSVIVALGIKYQCFE